MILTVLFLVIVFACVGVLYPEGLWSNAIRLVNVVVAALLAMNFFEPLANYLYEQAPTFTYFWDFLALWAIFVGSYALLRAVTNVVSRVNVRFLTWVDRVGSGLLAALIGWVMVCFTAATLHTAPLAREAFGGEMKPEARAASASSPEMMWLGFVQKQSKGAFGRSASPAETKAEKYVFDPQGDFLPKYASRRTNLENYLAKFGALRVLPTEADKHN